MLKVEVLTQDTRRTTACAHKADLFQPWRLPLASPSDFFARLLRLDLVLSNLMLEA